MAVTEEKPASDGGCWGFFKMPFRHSGGTSSSAFTLPSPSGASASASSSVESESACHSFSVAKSFLPTKRRLKLDPATKLYFPYEPFQTTAPKSCFMRPPGAILAPGETIIATVFKFAEPPESSEKDMDQRGRVNEVQNHEPEGERPHGPCA
ncbi:PREDICTED: vesicle-associated protein 4-2-like isoform X2 [Tarenaya hassleriana]|uniref:vesicle-associated protein 4-2-like isoform X2 n=1 Tax=Tarenaya hassleriana TaxID=28532 RepID=UPI0008FD31B1|nr:PREDICTED: vesicle-associated protein 4-2-like isoform X2 [Tarenaya hassleriana]XP_019058065.1 PREDICTED: vesicle-associated protein 4-2-like isoform X2 [Tarenaya hassleriana]